MGWLSSTRGAWGQTAAAAPAGAEVPVEGPTPPVPPPPPPPPGPSPEEVALKAAQVELRAELETFEAILAAEREQRAEEVVGLREKLDKAEATLKKPPVTTSKGGVGLSGYVQGDWALWRQSSEDQLNPGSGAPLNDERFSVRRARLRTTFDKTYYGGALEFDGNTTGGGSPARIVGAEASFKLPGDEGAPLPLLMATIGLFKIPFGFELLQSDRDRLFLERSWTERALFAGEYDVGARLQGGWLFLRYAIAVQNGEPLGEKSAFPGRDPNAAKDVSGRLGVETTIVEAVTVSAGVSGLKGTGFHPGLAATKPTLQWSDRNEDGAFSPGEIVATTGSAASPSSNFGRFALGFDLRLAIAIPNVGTATLYGELYKAKNLDRAILIADPNGGVARDYRELGAYVGATLDLTDLGSLGVRYDTYDPDRDSTDPAMTRVLTSSSYGTLAVVAAVGTPTARLVVEYDHNTNHNGRDMQGRPTALKDDALIARGQVSF
jgi:Phosphate-selective porin O and P